MTLQQLRYVIAVVQAGSMNVAASRLYISQPGLSGAIGELEREFGITIFARGSKGVTLTEEGTRFLSYARQVVEQADLLESKYKSSAPPRRVFSVSAQHYAFVVNAFVSLVKELGGDEYEFSLRETRTYDIIEDVRTLRSELGVVYLSAFNRSVMTAMIKKADLRFTPLFTARPHVFVASSHPLAGRSSVSLDDLRPYLRLTFEQGVNNSFYFAEELYASADAAKSVVVSDRATLFNLLIGLSGYTISSGVIGADLNGDNIVSVPLDCDESMEIGYLDLAVRPHSYAAERYLYHLRDYIGRYNGKRDIT